jgi:hypothetical protein
LYALLNRPQGLRLGGSQKIPAFQEFPVAGSVRQDRMMQTPDI